MNDLDKNLDIEDFEPRVYEIGYHIIPTVAEDNLASVVDEIRESIKSLQGVIISEGNPQQMELSYSMGHVVSNKKTICSSAYFGWIKFEGNPENVIKIKDALDKNENVLRFIIIKTVKEDTLPKKINTNTKTKQEVNAKNIKKIDEVGVVKEETKKEVVSEAEVDKAIEELVA